jgi:hypothetical protein
VEGERSRDTEEKSILCLVVQGQGYKERRTETIYIPEVMQPVEACHARLTVNCKITLILFRLGILGLRHSIQ